MFTRTRPVVDTTSLYAEATAMLNGISIVWGIT